MLWLLRHAEAAEGRPDEARPLTPRGLEQARTAGLALARLGVRLDALPVESQAPRDGDRTARLRAAGPRGHHRKPALAGSMYDPERLAAGLGDTVLVGHDPTISNCRCAT